jgi:biotin-dependent carboxylase-like uncharacterized protein
MSNLEIEVLDAGLQTTVQDYPGRPGLQAQGFFPAGPMDHLAFRAANLLVGNPPGAAGLEIVVGRSAFRFGGDCVVAACGAEGTSATLNGAPVPLWQSVPVSAGDELKLGLSRGPGFRVYLAVSGGVDVPEILGSRATYTMGALGGYEGRALRKGDLLPVGEPAGTPAGKRWRFREDRRPQYGRHWEVEAMRGPQADPDYLTEADMAEFFDRAWKVDANSNRVGIRLETHKWGWARTTGGVAGGHPSNILDDSYPVGGVNMNGDVPVILGPDGPTSGGFVIAATVVHGGLWKLGQIRPGADTIRFKEVSIEEAVALANDLDAGLTEASLEVVP